MGNVAGSEAVAALSCGEDDINGAGMVDLDVDVEIDVDDPDSIAVVRDLALSPASTVVYTSSFVPLTPKQSTL